MGASNPSEADFVIPKISANFASASHCQPAPAVRVPGLFLLVEWLRIYFLWVQFHLQPPTFYRFHPSKSQNWGHKCPKLTTALLVRRLGPPPGLGAGPVLGVEWPKIHFSGGHFPLQPPTLYGVYPSKSQNRGRKCPKLTTAP